MKRLYSVALIFIYTIFANNPAFTADKELVEQQPELFGESQAESILDDSNITVKALGVTSDTVILPENELINEEEVEDSKNASSSVSLPDKKENPWAENITGKQLNTLKNKLEQLQELYNLNWRSSVIAEAINTEEKASGPQKRNNTLVNDISRQQLFSLYAATLVFPELLEIHLKDLLDKQKNRSETLVDEIVETDEETQRIIKTYANDIENVKSTNKAYKALIEKAHSVLNAISRKNNKTSNLTNLGYYIKKVNTDILNLISEQLDDMRTITEQLDLAVEYCELEYGPMSMNDNSVSVKGKYIAEIRSSLKDILELINKYKYKQDFRFYKFSQYYKDHNEQLKARIGNDEIKSKHILKNIKNYGFLPVSKSLEVFDAKADLNNIFELFGFKDADEELLKNLISYISSESWHIRYHEPLKENKEINFQFNK